MTKHTPGPWEIRSRNDGSKSITGAYHHPAGHHPLAGGILHVCDLSGDKHHDEANARLIAAAPDLLAALRCFLDDPRFQVGVGGNPIIVERMIGQARAAHAKATGE